MRLTAILVLIGLAAGGAVGYLTAPQPAVEMRIGPVAVEVQKEGGGSTVTATDGGRSLELSVGDPSMLSDRTTRTAVFGIAGGAIGLLAGVVAGRRKG